MFCVLVRPYPGGKCGCLGHSWGSLGPLRRSACPAGSHTHTHAKWPMEEHKKQCISPAISLWTHVEFQDVQILVFTLLWVALFLSCFLCFCLSVNALICLCLFDCLRQVVYPNSKSVFLVRTWITSPTPHPTSGSFSGHASHANPSCHSDKITPM